MFLKNIENLDCNIMKDSKNSLNLNHQRTSIGNSPANTKPKNKDKRRSYKKYRGQGKHR